MASVRINSGDYVTVTGQRGLTRVEVWRIVQSPHADATARWNLYVYTESTAGLEDGVPQEFLDWDRWEYVDSYRTKHDARASLPL
jgi:hypothetical protein